MGERMATKFRNEAGGVSVEFVLWVPLVLSLMMLVFEATAAFMAQASSWRTATHVARAVTTGQMTIPAAEQLVRDRLGYAVTMTTNQGLLRVDVSIPYSQIGFGIFAPWGDMRVALLQRIEPHVSL
jgi:Flp pilus assembly protein TadG